MPTGAQLIKIFPRISWNLQFITRFMSMSLNTLLKHDQSNSILIKFLKIPPYSHRPSELTLSFTSKKSDQDYLHSQACHSPYQFCQCTLIAYYLTCSTNHEPHIMHPFPPIPSVISSNIILLILLSNSTSL